MTITHAIYLVRDTEKAIVFLKNTFEFTVTADETTITGDRFLTMGESNGESIQLQIVEIDKQPEIAARKREAGTVDFIFETEDIQKMIARVNHQGLKIHREPTNASYGWTAIFEDPFGNLWDLIQRH